MQHDETPTGRKADEDKAYGNQAEYLDRSHRVPPSAIGFADHRRTSEQD
jgi:hypothetical protein